LLGNSTSAGWTIKLRMSGPFSSWESLMGNWTTLQWAFQLLLERQFHFKWVGNLTSAWWIIKLKKVGHSA
jgi:hypothetical protein